MDTSASSSGCSCMDKLHSFLHTQKGVLLAAEILLSFIIIICYTASIYRGYSGVAISEMVFAAVFFVIFMMELDKQFRVVHWVWSDLLRAVVGSLLYIITSFISIKWHRDGAHLTAVMLGFATGLLMAYDTFTIALQLHGTRWRTAAPADVDV